MVVSSKDKDGRHGFGRIADKALPTGSVDISGVFAINGKQLLDIFYPIGTIYESTKPNSPSTFMGGTWARFGNGRVLVGVDESDIHLIVYQVFFLYQVLTILKEQYQTSFLGI